MVNAFLELIRRYHVFRLAGLGHPITLLNSAITIMKTNCLIENERGF